MVAKTVYDRYDGRLRTGLTEMDVASWGYSGNPFGDDECGKFYGRAMSVWSLLLACQGYYCNGPEKIIGFDPQWKPEDHASFFTSPQGWGLFEQKRSPASQTDVITVAWGKLDVAEVHLTVVEGTKIISSDTKVSDQSVSAELIQDGNRVILKFKTPITIDTGKALEVSLNSK
jgi:hypothetical protein